MQNTILNFDLKIKDLTSALDDVKTYIKEYDCPEISMDLSELNILDATRVLIVSSAYHYGKYPHGKIRCKCMSNVVEDLVAGIVTSNLELV